VKHWGYKFDYKTRLITKENCIPEIPEFLKHVIQKLVKNDIVPFESDQVTVNVYEPGDGIPSHVETHSVFEVSIVIFSYF
jgi:alkylated DNA repair protein alkB family protein 8